MDRLDLAPLVSEVGVAAGRDEQDEDDEGHQSGHDLATGAPTLATGLAERLRSDRGAGWRGDPGVAVGGSAIGEVTVIGVSATRIPVPSPPVPAASVSETEGAVHLLAEGAQTVLIGDRASGAAPVDLLTECAETFLVGGPPAGRTVAWRVAVRGR